MGLVLGRKLGEKFLIGNAVVEVTSIKRNRVNLRIEAPKDVTILREELTDDFQQRKQEARK